MKTLKYRVINTRKFHFTINAKYIYYSIVYYENYILSCLIIINDIFYYCKLIILVLSLIVVLRFNPIVIAAIKNCVINSVYFNHYGQDINKYFFYLLQKKFPKFFYLNLVNVVICQDYPLVFESFILIKKLLIIQYHLIISILKLGLNGILYLVVYQRVCGHTPVFLQSLRTLSTIFLLLVI